MRRHSRSPRSGSLKTNPSNLETFMRNALIVMIVILLLGIWKASSVLEEHLRKERNEAFYLSTLEHHRDTAATTTTNGTTTRSSQDENVPLKHAQHGTTTAPPRYLVYTGVSNGQGAGQILHGMLAAYLFALEFNRTPCVKWNEFLSVFEYTDPTRKEICAKIIEETPDEITSLWNFANSKVDECALTDKLRSMKKIVSIKGNTYPGWRSHIPKNFFFDNFRARQRLLDFLPYDYRHPPETVVHFRSPDAKADSNRGLDPESLRTIGQLLKGNDTYLVTNRPDWYKRFHKCCGWNYDHTWNEPIRHWGLNLEWRLDGSKSNEDEDDIDGFTKPEQTWKLYSDWYTMLTAKRVYHSSSDFSGSAVHWNPDCTGYVLSGMKNETINGTTTRVLNLLPAGYDDPSIHIPPLVERQRPDSFHNDDNCVFLRFCKMYQNESAYTSRRKAKILGLVDRLAESHGWKGVKDKVLKATANNQTAL